MTFSGLPSLRDPKHSLKNSSSSSSPDSSPNSSPISKPSYGQQQFQQHQQQQHQQGLGNHDLSANDVLSTLAASMAEAQSSDSTITGSGPIASVAAANVPTETISTGLIENFSGLIQSSFGHVLNTLPHQSSPQGIMPPSQSSTVEMHQLQLQQPLSPTILLPPPRSTPSTGTKKKATPQNLSPAHSAAYRKRLNVNQVCDWCRYRKIRCDRESPCNSCQHSKRECIRTPPSVLLANQQNAASAEDQESSVSSPASSTGKTKRVRAINKDGRSRHASKSYRGSSISSQRSSSYASYSSDNEGTDGGEDDDEDESKSVSSSRPGESSVSPVVGSLTLAGLGLSTLGLSLNGLQQNHSLDTTRSSDFQLTNPPSFASSVTTFHENSFLQQVNSQDQEHLERLQRIEMLLSNVIPGAAEFIANGSQVSLTQQQQHYVPTMEKKESFLLSHSVDQQDHMMSPQEHLANMSLASPNVNTSVAMPWSGTSTLSSIRNEVESSEIHSSSSAPHVSGAEYVERMKRIEMLLGTIQDAPLAKALLSQSQDQSLPNASPKSSISIIDDPSKISKKTSKKKQGKTEGKKSNYNSDGTLIKRPHVAAGFAGQKPPPKLPQAIAEAAQKKQANRKKRVTAAAAKAAAATTAAIVSPRLGLESDLLSLSPRPLSGANMGTIQNPNRTKMGTRMTTHSTTASLEIPSTFDNEPSTSSYSHHHQQQQHQQRMLDLQQRQQQQHQLQIAHNRNSISFQPQTQAICSYPQQQQQQRQLPMSSSNSMSIPITDSMASYGSLVVPASSSANSSPSSSPNLSEATAMNQDNMVMSGHSHQQQQHQDLHLSFPQTGDFEMGFDMDQTTNDAQTHPFAITAQQQQPQHQSIQINQDGFSNFGLSMNESLEGLMKKSMGSFDHLIEGFQNNSTSLVDSHHHHLYHHQQQQQQLTPSTPAVSSDQFSYFQNLQQVPTPQQQHFQQQQQQQSMTCQDMSRNMWMPNNSGATVTTPFSVPANLDYPWSSQQNTHISSQPQQHQGTMQSINISANDSPREELDLDLSIESQQAIHHHQQQQQQLNAHSLFQQQHQEQQRRHMEHQQQQQQHRASIQHQHQQTFYIPQLQDDEDDEI
ncbi:hypothetical protein FBU30_006909 [Linnemannia zychae]|nr:hypothetical protein FBU30_006909 [Linnemannia zychae]